MAYMMGPMDPEVSSGQRLLFQAQPDVSVMKLTRGHSCVLCQQRKVRCDKNKPCANCVRAQVECRVVPPQPPRRRKKKPHGRDLIERLRKYEALLSQHGIKFEPLGRDFKVPDPGEQDDVDDIEHGMEQLKTSPSSAADLSSSAQGSQSGERRPAWFPYLKEFKQLDDILRDSSDSDEGPTIHHAFDTAFGNGHSFPFSIGEAAGPVTEFHPSGIQIFQLWQIYLDNVNPLLKLTHTPTLQGQIIEAGANLGKISKPLEVLMFSIYLAAVNSMHEDEVQSTFGASKNSLLSKYHHATRLALVNAGFMRSSELMVLQAFLIYLICVRQYVDPRSLFCLIGIAVRVAHRMGLHRDGAIFNLPPFEVELRRRLWWQLVTFDKRIGEVAGCPITALSSTKGDCRWPLNINDIDLHVGAQDPPASSAGATEMLFPLTRLEFTTAAAAADDAMSPMPSHLGEPRGPRLQFSASPLVPDVVAHMAHQNLPRDVDGFCRYVEDTYLRHCDEAVPAQLFTLLMTRQSLCRLHVIEHIVRRPAPGGGGGGGGGEEPDPARRAALFLEAIRAVEYDNQMHASAPLRGFLWYAHMHFPLPAYVFLVSELRDATTGALCERAWRAAAENHERRGRGGGGGGAHGMRTPMHVALGGLLVKAWDARAAAEAARGRAVEEPGLVAFLRQYKRGGGKSGKPDDGPGPPPAAAAAAPPPPHGGPFDASGGAPAGGGGLDDAIAFAPADPAGGFLGPQEMMDFEHMDLSSLMQGFAAGSYGGGFGFGGFDMGGYPS